MTKLTITQRDVPYVVRAGGAILGESSAVLELREEGRAPVLYFPKADIAMAFLDESSHETTCPLKGTARYFSIVTKSTTLENAAWSYETPVAGAEAIAGHLAFEQRDEVTVEEM